ncbi:Coiled-coil-helix-coiled-coil-helix domain-containing protein 10 [Dermatophagoides pteronyssinus]|uniref:Coiled-coil-helix-coiled-coil-helix domain-containing protein 10 n=1 Tax=Dermatophagoides pteronyssinus TaxID=6956 RepID=A0ABQ8JVP2_DERPT|nr:Coiled-coil-helix-coiled-coil-helix domain-containing protein 10 [Dermatophagoides pteronyssinus]
MGRRGRSSPSSSPMRSSFGPARPSQPRMAASRPTPPPPSHAPSQSVPMRQQPAAVAPAPAPSQGPGLLGQMAATAGGVAIGSAVGHTIGHAITGSMGSGQSVEQPAAAAAQTAPAPAQYGSTEQQQQQPPCQYEMKQFMDCAQNYDLTLCEGFNEALKQCRLQYPSARI